MNNTIIDNLELKLIKDFNLTEYIPTSSISTVLSAISISCNNIITNISVMSTDISVMSTDISVMSTNISVMSTDISVLSTDISTMSTDISGLSIEVSAVSAVIDAMIDRLSTDISVISTDISVMSTDISGLSSEVSVVSAVIDVMIDRLSTDISTMSTDISVISVNLNEVYLKNKDLGKITSSKVLIKLDKDTSIYTIAVERDVSISFDFSYLDTSKVISFELWIKKLNDSCNVTFARSIFIDVDTDFTIDVGNTLCVFRTFDGGNTILRNIQCYWQ